MLFKKQNTYFTREAFLNLGIYETYIKGIIFTKTYLMSERINNYPDFYQFYLTEHKNKTSRILHFIGTFLVFTLISIAIYNNWSWKWFLVPIVGYGFAWVGHAFFERNKPATFKYPFWSLISDFKLFFEILLGKRSFDSAKD